MTNLTLLAQEQNIAPMFYEYRCPCGYKWYCSRDVCPECGNRINIDATWKSEKPKDLIDIWIGHSRKNDKLGIFNPPVHRDSFTLCDTEDDVFANLNIIVNLKIRGGSVVYNDICLMYAGDAWRIFYRSKLLGSVFLDDIIKSKLIGEWLYMVPTDENEEGFERKNHLFRQRHFQ
ncbi:MAG: hypothetical protein WCY30_02285 [Candidatus Neomarinimicrobiota bacterium]|jgi:hypothetical protein